MQHSRSGNAQALFEPEADAPATDHGGALWLKTQPQTHEADRGRHPTFQSDSSAQPPCVFFSLTKLPLEDRDGLFFSLSNLPLKDRDGHRNTTSERRSTAIHSSNPLHQLRKRRDHCVRTQGRIVSCALSGFQASISSSGGCTSRSGVSLNSMIIFLYERLSASMARSLHCIEA